MPEKMIAAGMGGVFVPIIIEFGAKGAKISDSIPYKISGVVGTVVGAVPVVGYFVKKDYFEKMKPESRNAILAFGASSLATGISILVLDELRKRAGYTFRGNVPLGMPEHEGLTAPVGQIIKEI